MCSQWSCLHIVGDVNFFFLFFFLLIRRPLRSTLFPYTTLFRSTVLRNVTFDCFVSSSTFRTTSTAPPTVRGTNHSQIEISKFSEVDDKVRAKASPTKAGAADRKSTRLNSSHLGISYAVFCLKKK